MRPSRQLGMHSTGPGTWSKNEIHDTRYPSGHQKPLDSRRLCLLIGSAPAALPAFMFGIASGAPSHAPQKIGLVFLLVSTRHGASVRLQSASGLSALKARLCYPKAATNSRAIKRAVCGGRRGGSKVDRGQAS
jgi:hypothetical protein